MESQLLFLCLVSLLATDVTSDTCSDDFNSVLYNTYMMYRTYRKVPAHSVLYNTYMMYRTYRKVLAHSVLYNT